MIEQPIRVHESAEWNRLLKNLPNHHLLQSWEWGALKEKYGWKAERMVWCTSAQQPIAAAQILCRHVRLPGLAIRLSVLYCPKGPILDWADSSLRLRVIGDLKRMADHQAAILLKIDPNIPTSQVTTSAEGKDNNAINLDIAQELARNGWRESAEQIQFRNTMILDLTPAESDILAAMKQKTRYNIRLASRRGVRIRQGDVEDIDVLYRMYAETSLRDGFTIRNPAYYRDLWSSFIKANLAQPFIAEVDGDISAALIAFQFGETAYYLFGMSRSIHREKMPNHLLQWEAIRWAKSQGCKIYDFWGAPDHFDPKDPMWGVYRFKQGFGAQVFHTIGAWDYPARPMMYWLYSIALPRFLAIMRSRGQTQTRHSLEQL